MRVINQFYKKKKKQFSLLKNFKQNNFVFTNKRHTLHTHKNNNNKRKLLLAKQYN